MVVVPSVELLALAVLSFMAVEVALGARYQVARIVAVPLSSSHLAVVYT